MLFVPADSERKLAKASAAGADAIILDLEDSVLPERKASARGLANEYMASRPQHTPLWVRVNDLASGEMLRDLAAVMPARPAGIILPKIHGPEDVHRVTHYLEAFEESCGCGGANIPILALVTETPSAVLRMGELVGSPMQRLSALGWGAEDLSAAIGAGDPRLPSGAWRSMYEHVRSQCILAAHALAIEAIDTVYVNFKDSAGLKLACQASRYDGFTGRFAIHPDQVPVINQAFTPSAAELALARRIIDAFAGGAGAVSLDGKMYDIPHLKAARRLVTSTAAMPATLYDICVNKINGDSATLKEHEGAVLLVVNVASKCGMTPQYAGLEALQKKYAGKNFSVLGFPANDFAGQEPGNDHEIQQFCTLNFGVQFPLYSKIHVTGSDKHPLYRHLTNEKPDTEGRERMETLLRGHKIEPSAKPEVVWNFEKFLVDRHGRVVRRFAPDTEPDAPALVEAIEAELAKA